MKQFTPGSMLPSLSSWSLVVWVSIILLLVGSLSACTNAGGSDPDPISGDLIIFHAGSLTLPVDELAARFESLHPEVQIKSEAAGSRTTARKISELGREADLVMSADYRVIETLLIPEHASWNVLFARNAMVVAYTGKARYAEEINQDNWHQILTREGVQVGRSNPQADPNGYRTLMVWQLAEVFYDLPGLYQRLEANSPPKNIRPKETDLIPLLQSGDLDYAFNYLSVAQQHNLAYIPLPPEVNLSDPLLEADYHVARVELDGADPQDTIIRLGEPIIYGLTIPHNAPNPILAELFLAYLFSDEGRAIIQQQGQIPFEFPLSKQQHLLPESIQNLVGALP